jgi:hypothetical protein
VFAVGVGSAALASLLTAGIGLQTQDSTADTTDNWGPNSPIVLPSSLLLRVVYNRTHTLSIILPSGRTIRGKGSIDLIKRLWERISGGLYRRLQHGSFFALGCNAASLFHDNLGTE